MDLYLYDNQFQSQIHEYNNLKVSGVGYEKIPFDASEKHFIIHIETHYQCRGFIRKGVALEHPDIMDTIEKEQIISSMMTN